MKAFARRYRGYLWWLAGLAVFFAAYFSFRNSRTAMNWLCGRIVLPFEQAVGRLCGLTSVSVAEVLILSGIYIVIFYLAWQLRCLLTRPHKGRRLCRVGLTALCTALSVYAGFCLLWGVGTLVVMRIVHPVVADLVALIPPFVGVILMCFLYAVYAVDVVATANQIQRDENGCFAVPRSAIFADAMTAYDGVVEEFDCLKKPNAAPKAFVSSRGMSYLDFSGFYFPFTGEANLNDESPACHELAHQQGIATEQECNFVGILAAITAESPAYQYSGYLMGYVHLANALYRAAPETWQTLRDSLPDTVRADLRQNSAYWAQFDGLVNTAATKVYDGFLKSNGLTDGVQNYGTVVDLLLAYFGGK